MTVLASGILLHRGDRAEPRLLLLRNARTGQWGFPKGRRDDGDRHEVATALREIEEETGYAGLVLDDSFRAEIEYVVRNDGDTEYGKRVTYFLARAPGGEPVLSHEHDDHAWASPDDVGALLEFGQLRDLAAAAFEALRGTS